MQDDGKQINEILSKIDYILQLRLKELKSDKGAATSYSVRYREVINSFEKKIFASATAVVDQDFPDLLSSDRKTNYIVFI